jgi:predicted transcriptional regulator
MKTVTQEVLYGWKEIAIYLGCTPPTARKYAENQSLPVTKIAGRIMISKSTIGRWLRDNKKNNLDENSS